MAATGGRVSRYAAKRTRGFPSSSSSSSSRRRSFQSNGHCWKTLSFFLVSLNPFSGMCGFNFLSVASGSLYTSWIYFIYLIFLFSNPFSSPRIKYRDTNANQLITSGKWRLDRLANEPPPRKLKATLNVWDKSLLNGQACQLSIGRFLFVCSSEDYK